MVIDGRRVGSGSSPCSQCVVSKYLRRIDCVVDTSCSCHVRSCSAVDISLRCAASTVVYNSRVCIRCRPCRNSSCREHCGIIDVCCIYSSYVPSDAIDIIVVVNTNMILELEGICIGSRPGAYSRCGKRSEIDIVVHGP